MDEVLTDKTPAGSPSLLKILKYLNKLLGFKNVKAVPSEELLKHGVLSHLYSLLFSRSSLKINHSIVCEALYALGNLASLHSSECLSVFTERTYLSYSGQLLRALPQFLMFNKGLGKTLITSTLFPIYNLTIENKDALLTLLQTNNFNYVFEVFLGQLNASNCTNAGGEEEEYEDQVIGLV